MKRHTLLILLSLILIGFVVRLHRVSALRLTHDEMSIGYNAYSILETGKDEWGESFPLYFRAFGDYKLPIYIYLTTLSVGLLGLIPLAVKLPSVVAGTIFVALVYFIARKLHDNKYVGFIAAAVAAFSPVALHLSRSGLEANVALAIFAGAILALLHARQRRRAIPFWLLAGGLLALTFYTYIAYRVVALIVLAAVVAFNYFKKRPQQENFALIGAFAIVLLPLIPSLVGASGTARFSQVSIFQEEGFTSQSIESVQTCFLVGSSKLAVLCRLFFNKAVFIAVGFATTFLKILSPNFLFITGDELEYLSNPGFGEFYFFLLPFYLLGGWYLLKKHQPGHLLIFLLLLAAPIPAALTGSPQIVRSSAVILPVVLMIAFGVMELWKLLPDRRWQIGVGGVFIATALFFVGQYLLSTYYIYPFKYDREFYLWGDKVARYINQRRDQYETIHVNPAAPDSHILFAFYGQYDPAWYRQAIERQPADDFGFSHPQQLDTFVFETSGEEKYLCDPDANNVLFVNHSSELIDNPELPGVTALTNYSGVHTQAQITDIDELRTALQEAEVYGEYCPETAAD